MKAQDYKISSEKFVFHSTDGNLHDNKLETKPVSYFRDALNRFAKNKASILAFVIIMVLVLFAIIGPIVTPYTVSYADTYYRFALPKNPICVNLGLKFWDGGQEKEVNKATYDLYRGIQEETGRTVIMTEPTIRTEEYMGKTKELYSFRLDTYNCVGVIYKEISTAEYESIQKYQDENGVQVIYPITDPTLRPKAEQDQNNGNIWYKTKLGAGRKTEIVYNKEGDFIPIYKEADGTDGYTSTMYWEGDEKLYNYAQKMDGDQWKVRVDYREYYIYSHAMAGDGITEPLFILGTTDAGQDIFTCLSSGARFSFILAVIVASVNLFVGAIYGAIEGYYGGKIDLIMERIVDLLASIPFMIVITLLKYHFNVSHLIILFISFFLTGWTGMAGRTRMQFYRFKNQEYVLVARTLGARDRRIMFKHIFPNAIGTLITSSVLIVPSVIFSETSLTYLGIIDLNTGDLTSVGTLLAKGQNYLFTYPHIILFPAIFISLLMLSFNLFGNGLRDAFNPSLRGTEE
ncbi:MAG: ABC transporter permease [Oscillospiraceae bacterium]|nr:ABC transporter permease [Oscillospiraceae bacterium]